MSAAGSTSDLPTLTLPPSGNSPSRARNFAAARLKEWDLPASEGAVLLLISELVTNAALHARTEMVVAVTRSGGCILVEVSDESSATPTIRPFSSQSATGRGLQLIDTLARAWGVRRVDGGKTVWAEIATDSAAAAVLPLDLDGIDAV